MKHLIISAEKSSDFFSEEIMRRLIFFCGNNEALHFSEKN